MTINKDILNFIYENSSVSLKYRILQQFWFKKIKNITKRIDKFKKSNSFNWMFKKS